MAGIFGIIAQKNSSKLQKLRLKSVFPIQKLRLKSVSKLHKLRLKSVIKNVNVCALRYCNNSFTVCIFLLILCRQFLW